MFGRSPLRVILPTVCLCGSDPSAQAGATAPEVEAPDPPRLVIQAERAIPNDNRVAAGAVVNGVLRLSLEARAVDWFPEDTTGPAVPVYAFAETGAAARVPGPMIRIPVGTEVRVTLHNRLQKPLTVRGLQSRALGAADSIILRPGASQEAEFRADVAGTFYYWGRTEPEPGSLPGRGRDGSLFGAFIVDSAGAAPRPDERILVITMWTDSAAALGIKTDYADRILRREFVPRTSWLLMAVNGRSWPHTERLSYTAGDTVRWRVINGARFPHPMHLHGFHFTVEARGGAVRDTIYEPAERRTVVTEWMTAGQTMAMSWHAARAGNWLFHCHLVTHISDANAATPRPAHEPGHGNHAEQGMAGLVLGIHVRPTETATLVSEPEPGRRLRLFVTERPNGFGDRPAYSYVLQEGPAPPASDSVRGAGSTMVLRQNEPTEITVTNFAKHATSIHWHGIELQSFYDGVGGWSGSDRRLAPLIAPGDSFVVRVTPPRAGTFIYHTHVSEGIALASGLYGALIVLPADAPADTSVHVVLVSIGGPHDEARPLVNGTIAPSPMVLRAGAQNRLRFINISPLETHSFQLSRRDTVLEWRAVAKDGADIPPQQATLRPATIAVHPGETYDFEVLRPGADSLTLTVISPEILPIRATAFAQRVPAAQFPRIRTRIPVIVR